MTGLPFPGTTASADHLPSLGSTAEVDVLKATITRLRKSVRELDRLCAQQQEHIRGLTAERDALKETTR
jgi:hypothetical protein